MDDRDGSEEGLTDGIQSIFWKFPKRIQHLIAGDISKGGDETTPLLKAAPDRQLSVTSEKTKEKLTLVTFAIIYITAAASYSVIAPFYPTEVKAQRSEEATAY